MSRADVFIVAAAIVLLAAGSVDAQTASVTGRVTDAQGAALVNAAVTLTLSTGRRVDSRTGGDGSFSFDQVPAGSATLQVDVPGFASWRQTVTAAVSPAPLTIALRVAGLQEAVRVVGSTETTLDAPAPTGSRLGLTPLETPASVSVLLGDAIRERGVQSVVEAKSQAVGVTNKSNPGNSGGGVALRGFSDTASVMQLFDGELMFVGNNTVSFPFDPWMVERIEVLGGPAGVLYGNGAIGGVVNVVPKRPNARSTESSVRVAAGSFNTWRGAADTAGPIGTNTSYLLGFSGNRSDGWLKNHSYPSDTTAFSASLRHQFRPNLSLTVSEDFGYQRPFEYFGTATIDGTVEAARRDVNYNTTDAKIWYRDSWTQAKLEWQPSPNVSVRNSVRLIDRAGYWFNVEEYVYLPATNQIARAIYLEAGSWMRQYGDRTDVIVSSRPFGRSNTLSAGFDYNFVNYRVNWNNSFG
jgi:iron complex outermembrane receptor protein